jgi:phenylpyruvate tautomerase PptA (4-oxalocrotonate tautomerase family)
VANVPTPSELVSNVLSRARARAPSAADRPTRNVTARRTKRMPFAKIHIRKGHGAQKKRAIADALQASLVATLDIPEQDRFQLIEEYEADHFIHTDAFLGLTYTRGLLMIEIAFTEGRSDALKKTLLADLNRRLVETADVRPDDVVVLIYELWAANVSLGRGLTQRAP